MSDQDGIIIPLIPDTTKLDAALQSTMDKVVQTGAVTAETAAKFTASQNKMAESVNTTTNSVNNLATSTKQLGQQLVGGALKEGEQALKGLGDEATQTTQKHIQLRSQIRQMTNALVEMRLAGLEGTKQFIDLQNQTAKLSREMIITRGSVRSLAEEFGTLKAAGEAVHGLNAAMQVGVGVSSLLADGNEKVEKEIRSLMGVMLIANGIQETANLLKEDSVLRIKAEAAWTATLTYATNLYAEASAAAWAATLGWIALVVAGIATVVYAYEELIGASHKAEEAQERINEQSKIAYDTFKLRQEQIKSESETQVQAAEENLKLLKAQKASTEDLRKAEEQLTQARVAAASAQLTALGGAVDKYNQDPAAAEEAVKKMIGLLDELEKKKETIENANSKLNPLRYLFGAQATESIKKQKEAYDSLIEQIKAVKDALAEYDKVVSDQVNEKLEHERAKRRESIDLEVSYAKEKVLIQRKGSDEEDNARIAEINKELKLQLFEIETSGKMQAQKNIDAKIAEQQAADKINELHEAANKRYLQNELDTSNKALSILRDRRLGVTARENELKNPDRTTHTETDAGQITRQQNLDAEILDQEKQTLALKAALELESARNNAEQQKLILQKLVEDSDKLDADAEEKIRQRQNEFRQQRIADEKKANQKIHDDKITALDAKYQGSTIDGSKSFAQQREELKAASAQALSDYATDSDYNSFVKKNKAIAQAKTKIDLDEAKAIAKPILEEAKKLSDDIFKIENDNRNAKYNAEIENIKKISAFELNNKNLTEAQKASLQKKYDKEQAVIKLEQWKAEQAAKAEQAIINTALAITNALATTPFPASIATAAAAAAAGAAEVVVIETAKPPQFAKGTPKGAADTPYGMKLVGEQGPELIFTPGGERIITAPDTAAILQKYAIPQMPNAEFSTGDRAIGPAIPAIDYKQLGISVADAIKSNPQVKINIDENGFQKLIVTRGGKHEFVNKKFSA